MENTWIRSTPFEPSRFSDPFAYRAPLSDAVLDILDQHQRVNNTDSVMMGLITREEADRRNEERLACREQKKEGDRYLEALANVEYDTSDDSLDEGTLLTPPRSPDRLSGGLDLSIKAWKKECFLIHERRLFAVRDFGFENYETWKRYQIKHSQPRFAASKAELPHSSPPSQPPPSSPPHSIPTVQTRTLRNTRNSREGFKP